MRKKVIFIAHPLRGDIAGNTQKVLAICEQVHRQGAIPVAPYLVSLQYLNDEVHEDRQLGIDVNRACFHRRFIDELWLYGDRISPGMWEEVRLAMRFRIPLFGRTPETRRDLRIYFGKFEEVLQT